MLSDYFKRYGATYREPHELAKMLDFTVNGLLLWNSVKKVTNMIFEWRQYGYDQARIDKSLKDPKQACLLEFNLGEGKHWVVALRRIPFTKTYWIADPLTGSKKLSTKYGAVTGSAHFSIL